MIFPNFFHPKFFFQNLIEALLTDPENGTVFWWNPLKRQFFVHYSEIDYRTLFINQNDTSFKKGSSLSNYGVIDMIISLIIYPPYFHFVLYNYSIDTPFSLLWEFKRTYLQVFEIYKLFLSSLLIESFKVVCISSYLLVTCLLLDENIALIIAHWRYNYVLYLVH